MTATRIVPDVVPRNLRDRNPRDPQAAHIRARVTANAAGRTPGVAAPGPRRKAPTTRTDAAAARAVAAGANAQARRPASAAARTAAPVRRTAPAAAPVAGPAPRRTTATPSAPATATATARPLPLIAPQPRPQPARRPPLRIVTPPDPEARTRRRRRLWVGALVGLAGAGLFAIVGVRVLLAQGQGPVDKLESQVTAAQAENQRLRFDVARLESPSRIVAEAQSRLGMVPPAVVIYLPAQTPPVQTTTPAG